MFNKNPLEGDFDDEIINSEVWNRCKQLSPFSSYDSFEKSSITDKDRF